MLGSLMAVAKPGPESTINLANNWWKIIRKWYPDMHGQVYCVPPVHFNTVAYEAKPPKAHTCTDLHEYFGMRTYKPSQYSKMKDDEAQQRILWTLSTFLRNRKSTAFVLSNMKFQDYLNKGYLAQGTGLPNYPKPNIKNNEEGEVDVIIIDKKEGVFLLEVKAVGDSDAVRTVAEEVKLKVCIKYVMYDSLTSEDD